MASTSTLNANAVEFIPPSNNHSNTPLAPHRRRQQQRQQIATNNPTNDTDKVESSDSQSIKQRNNNRNSNRRNPNNSKGNMKQRNGGTLGRKKKQVNNNNNNNNNGGSNHHRHKNRNKQLDSKEAEEQRRIPANTNQTDDKSMGEHYRKHNNNDEKNRQRQRRRRRPNQNRGIQSECSNNPNETREGEGETRLLMTTSPTLFPSLHEQHLGDSNRQTNPKTPSIDCANCNRTTPDTSDWSWVVLEAQKEEYQRLQQEEEKDRRQETGGGGGGGGQWTATTKTSHLVTLSRRNKMAAAPATVAKSDNAKRQGIENHESGRKHLSNALSDPKTTVSTKSTDSSDLHLQKPAIPVTDSLENDCLAVHNHNRRWDMDRMRDRWWALLKAKRKRDEKLRQQQAELLLEERREEEEQTTKKIAQQLHEITSDESDDSDSTSALDSVDAISDPHSDSGSTYKQEDFPLHRAVAKGDERAIRHLLSSPSVKLFESRYEDYVSPDADVFSLNFTPLHLAVYLDRPETLRTLLQLSSCLKQPPDGNSIGYTPLMLACELGHSDCIQLLLKHLPQTLTSKERLESNTALHFVSSSSALSTIASFCKNATSLQKALLSKNRTGQTPLHRVCEKGAEEVLEAFLRECSSSVLLKMMRTTDNQGKTPLLTAIANDEINIVVTLQMWHGTHIASSLYSNAEAMPTQSTPPSSSLSPLRFAVAHGSIEMIHTLLEFGDYSSNNVDDLTAALQLAVHLESTELCRILIDAGADPTAALDAEAGSTGQRSALSLAAVLGLPQIVSLLVDSCRRQLKQRQVLRRQDHRLQNLTESYFREREEAENDEFQSALTDALIQTLVEQNLSSSVLLFKKGAQLSGSGLTEVMKSNHEDGALVTEQEHNGTVGAYAYTGQYDHFGDPNTTKGLQIGHYDRTALRFWSDQMLQLEWFGDTLDGVVSCSWMEVEVGFEPSFSPQRSGLIELVAAGDNQLLMAHASIVSQKSGKLAAAIRFAEMMDARDAGSGDGEGIVQVQVGISSRMLKLMLQHIYHGSIVKGWGPSLCHDLLELALIAEEFLCPSLLLECEMRLIAANPTQCFCWSCCSDVRKARNGSSAQCLFQARGPSQVLTAETCLDALAVAEQLLWTPDKYQLSVWPEDTHNRLLWKGYDSHKCLVGLRSPFAAVKDAAVRTVLLDFRSVLRGESFLLQIRGMVEEDGIHDGDSDDRAGLSVLEQASEAETMLLRLCLDELELNQTWQQAKSSGGSKGAHNSTTIGRNRLGS